MKRTLSAALAMLGVLVLLGAMFLPHAGRPAAASDPSHPPVSPETGGLALTVARSAGQATEAMNRAHYAAVTYVAATRDAAIRTYVDAVAYAEWVASLPPPAPPRSAPSPRGTAPTGGGGCGGATNGADQYIGRESGGNPYIGNGGGTYATPWDAGRAWGCYQILPSTWAGSCSDITTYDPASQARCASRLPDSAWAL